MPNDEPHMISTDDPITRSSVLDALKMLRTRRSALQLANNPLCRLAIVEARRPIQEHVSTAQSLGATLRALIIEAIQALKPVGEQPEPTSSRWRTYLLLDGYYLRGKSKIELVDEMSVAQSTIDHGLVEARDALASILRDMETNTALSHPPILHQLRAPIGEFVGRNDVVNVIVGRINHAVEQQTAALGCIHGMAGVGKTELAYYVCQRLEERFPDAQIIVECQRNNGLLLPPEEVLWTVIRAFEPQSDHTGDLPHLQARYRSLLSGKRVLILADDVGDITQIRALMPPVGSAVIATCRRHIRVAGTVTNTDLDVLQAQDAEQLLVNLCPRIAMLAPRLAKACGYLPIALHICAGLLASNPLLDVEAYLLQIEDEQTRLAALGNPDDARLDIQSVLMQSYALLDSIERHVLGQLSIFPTSFGIADAEAVVELPDPSSPTESVYVLADVVNHLIRNSLVRYDSVTQRCSLHDLVRVFAAARVHNADAVRWRHALHYAEVALDIGGRFQQGGTQIVGALRHFDEERAHIEAGWQWAIHQNVEDNPRHATLQRDYALATLGIGALRYDHRPERLRQLEAGLAAARILGDASAQRRLLTGLAWSHATLGELSYASELHEQSRRLALITGDLRGEAIALEGLAWIDETRGAVGEAIRQRELSLQLLQEIGDGVGAAYALGNLGWSCFGSGDLRRAIDYHTRSYDIMCAEHDPRGEAYALGNLATTYCSLGDVEQGLRCSQNSLALIRLIGDPESEAYVLGNVGWAYALKGELSQAITYHEQSLTLMQNHRIRKGEALALCNLAEMYGDSGETQRAITLSSDALAIARDIDDRRGQSGALQVLGQAVAAVGDTDRGLELCQQALVIANEQDDGRAKAKTLHAIGKIYAGRHAAQQAIECFEQGLAIAHANGDRANETLNAWNLALMLQQIDPARAVALMELRVAFEHAIGHVDHADHRAQLDEARGHVRVQHIYVSPPSPAAGATAE